MPTKVRIKTELLQAPVMSKISKDIKREIFTKEIMRDGNPIRALEVIEPDLQQKSKWNTAQRWVSDEIVSKKIERSLEDAGLSINYLNSRLKTLTVAEKQIILNNKLVPVPDNSSSIEAIKIGYRLHKVLDDNKTINIDQRQQSVDLSSEHLTKIDITVNKLENLNKQMQLSALSGEVIDAV